MSPEKKKRQKCKYVYIFRIIAIRTKHQFEYIYLEMGKAQKKESVQLCIDPLIDQPDRLILKHKR